MNNDQESTPHHTGKSGYKIIELNSKKQFLKAEIAVFCFDNDI